MCSFIYTMSAKKQDYFTYLDTLNSFFFFSQANGFMQLHNRQLMKIYNIRTNIGNFFFFFLEGQKRWFRISPPLQQLGIEPKQIPKIGIMCDHWAKCPSQTNIDLKAYVSSYQVYIYIVYNKAFRFQNPLLFWEQTVGRIEHQAYQLFRVGPIFVQ